MNGKKAIPSTNQPNNPSGVGDYFVRSADQIMRGNYTSNVTLLGTGGQVVLGAFGLDLPADFRDLMYDFTHWEWSLQHGLETFSDGLAFFPMIGVFKYTDEAGNLLKHGDVIKGGVNTGSTKGYYQDANGRWYRPNGQFASNAEVGISKPTTSVTNGSHGNSLSNPNTNYGYALVDKNTGEILKFGETLTPGTRYSQSYLDANNATMKILDSGSKEFIHNWQYDMNSYFKWRYGEYSKLNSKGW